MAVGKKRSFPSVQESLSTQRSDTMNQTETVQTLLSAIEREEWAEAASYLTSDFTFSGAVPQPISGQEWLGIHKAFAAAYSNFSFNYQPGDEEGQQVHCSVQLTGKHTRDLRLPSPASRPFRPPASRFPCPGSH